MRTTNTSIHVSYLRISQQRENGPKSLNSRTLDLGSRRSMQPPSPVSHCLRQSQMSLKLTGEQRWQISHKPKPTDYGNQKLR
ncbi:hypothetical protein FGO68_gene12841 [Halteria grandinella]|uniref:Uncharacterized protein n=1 Tax=Halteria grandinella TaxID=5974 RepID=A0A8J8P593_HALGN|nr:hypothetical protein FGO68_gene12841 [Halteria grandinella]